METLTLEQYPELFELFKPNIKIKDIKKKLKEIRGIDEKDLRFQIVFPNSLNEFNDDNNFMNNIKFQMYDITKYKTPISNIPYYFTRVELHLHNPIENLKKKIFESTKIPISQQKFYLDEIELNDYYFPSQFNLFEHKFGITIKKFFKDAIYLKYPNSEIKSINTDLCNTGLELLEQIINRL